MSELGRQLGDPVVLQTFLEYADYPEIVRLCATEKRLLTECRKSWAQEIIENKRAIFLEFLWSLDQVALKEYCKFRPDVCQVKSIRKLVNAIDATQFFDHPLVRKKALTIVDWNTMVNGTKVDFTQPTAWYTQELASIGDNIDETELMDAEDLIAATDMDFEMEVIDKDTGMVRFKWNGDWEEPQVLYVQTNEGVQPIVDGLPADTFLGVVPMLPLYELGAFPKVRMDRIFSLIN